MPIHELAIDDEGLNAWQLLDGICNPAQAIGAVVAVLAI
jgi:hypothetical protein